MIIMRHREYYQFLELDDGTEIRYSALKYSGVYFQCTTPDKTQVGGYKRAVTCWPDCIEPLRFLEVEGYTPEELDNLREYINKVGKTVVKMLQDESKERKQAMAISMRTNSFLLIVDAQQAGGYVAAYIKHEREVFQCKAKLKTNSFEEKIYIYGGNDSLKASFSLYYESPNSFLLELGDGLNRCFIQNDGDEEMFVRLSCSRQMRLLPGERKLICQQNVENYDGAL